MIYYNSNTINDWNFGDDNIIKVYHNNAVCYYKITSGDTPVQEPCFAVVDNISQYSDTEFEDVFNNADNKWYKLNNLNQYEEYGIYGEGRNITYYDGKLTVDDGYEYMHSGGSWVNLGEVSGSTITIKSPEYIERTSSYNGYCSLLEYLTEDTKFIIKHKQTRAGGGRIIGDYNSNDSDDWRFFFFGSTLYYDFITERKSTSKTIPMSDAEEWEIGNYYIKNTATGTYYINDSVQTFSSRPAPLYIYHSDGRGAGESGTDYGQIWYIKIYKNNVLVRDFIPWTDMNGNYGLYDKVENELVHTVGNMTASTVINDVEVGGGYEYPLEYVVREDPPDNLVFSSMEEAEEYECPWVGMKATIDGDNYVFSGDSQSGYEWVYNPSTFLGKWLATYSDSSVTSAECDSSSAITQNEIRIPNLVSVEIGNCVTSIGNWVFQNCTSLTSCTIGNGVTSIGNWVFSHCSGLTSINIPDSVTSIGDWAFASCRSLTSIDIPNSITSIGETAFGECISLTSIDIPSGVTSIGYQTFGYCTNLTSIDIPNSVTSIGNDAFKGCSSLTSITVNSTTPPSLGFGVFNKTNECPIYVPSASVETYKTAQGWSSYADRIQAMPT